VPSLKTIQNFNPAWIIPEPAATDIKRMISFEVLDQSKTKKKSNKTKNPNVQKIANHQPLTELFGLVAVTNAEKVILDRVQEKNGQITLFEESDDEKDRQANELRNLIGKLPSLSIFIDEVHHAVSDEIKLRAVVSKWTENKTVNSVIGFSGTPYLEKAEKIKITEELSVGTVEITNIVYYYPLIDGVGNFLKRPVVKIAEIADSSRIIENGVRLFFDTYKDTVYDGGLVAKLGIYCGTIEKLEEVVYPIVSSIAAEYGISSDAILKFHKGNKQYPQPADSQMQFDILDKSISKIRVVLLVQIGKEGWDCKSLTGIILSQEGDCPKNMVLQTSCRCLRQVIKGSPETALIYLNDTNADKLNAQLMQQHHVSLKEFSEANNEKTTIQRYDRTAYLKLPKVDFYQLKINYESLVIEEADILGGISKSTENTSIKADIIRTTNYSWQDLGTTVDDSERGNEPATFNAWLYRITKGSFGFITMEQLRPYNEALNAIFEHITYTKDGVRYYSSKYNHSAIEANIRKAFCDKCSFSTREELIPEEANLLNIANFTSTVQTEKPGDYYPDAQMVNNIILEDKGKFKVDPKIQQLIDLAKETGNEFAVKDLVKTVSSHPNRTRSFHYLPYRTDSGFEQTFLREVLGLDDVATLDLEVYYNGDRAMTEFKIKCYKNAGGKWSYVGIYTPDFLIIKRKDGKIHKAIIVETKGDIYKNDPTFKDKRTFMETEFARKNNEAFGYDRFDYLYLEDSLPDNDRIILTHKRIIEFFEEDEA
jgi:superfamily II DNA or RNA helicase